MPTKFESASSNPDNKPFTKIGLPSRADFPKKLSHNPSWRTAQLFLVDWGIVLAAISISEWAKNPFVFTLSVLVIASRQHALFVIMHEGAHGLLSSSRSWNDRLANWFAAWPVGFSTERYRLHHWIHHRYVNTEKDPDWVRKKDHPNWQFPMSKARFWVTSAPYALGRGVLEMLFALRVVGLRKSDIPAAVVYYGIVAVGLTVTGTWREFAWYWLVPYATVLPFLHRVRNAIEHLGLPKNHVLNGTRNVIGSPVEQFFFGPHFASFHLVHHVFPFIPWHRLPAAHEFLCSYEEYARYAHQNRAYFYPHTQSAFRDLTQESSIVKEDPREQRAA